MSVLGQKQTYAVQKSMSASHPLASAEATFRKRPCPLYPQKRTCAVHQPMSALGQKQTSRLFDHLVSELLEVQRHIEAQRLGGLDVDRKLILGRLLYR